MRPSSTASPTRRRPGADHGTRERLLDAATAVFADRGYAGSLREICRRARANNAAVNYHFRSKEGLYLEVVREAYRRIQRERPIVPPTTPPRDREEARTALRDLLRSFSAGLLEPRLRPHEMVLMREMLTPTAALDEVVEAFVRPRFSGIAAAIAPLLPDASEREVALRALGVIGQIVYLRWAAPIALRLVGEQEFSPALLDEVVEDVLRATEKPAGSRP